MLSCASCSSLTLLSQVDNTTNYLSTSVAVNIDQILPSNWVATVSISRQDCYVRHAWISLLIVHGFIRSIPSMMVPISILFMGVMARCNLVSEAPAIQIFNITLTAMAPSSHWIIGLLSQCAHNAASLQRSTSRGPLSQSSLPHSFWSAFGCWLPVQLPTPTTAYSSVSGLS